ncbi:MAG: hypothetical protein SFV23_09845 [Planctomycetaceae bacterium]|nr:hypothetical protein [Planctomycetaceae bacterium]
MTTLVYKRTHPYDPNEGGVFGIEDCMGTVRSRSFENVIGIGGICAEARSHGIDRKINWIGIGASVVGRLGRGPLIIFEHFLLLEEKGPLLDNNYPALAERFLNPRGPRTALRSFNKTEQIEIQRILALAKDAPPSTGDMTRDRPWPCKSTFRRKKKC